MQKEFIPYEQALELKELGYDEECLAWYNNRDIFIQESNNNRFITLQKNCSAPLYQQAFRWFREKYNLLADVTIDANRRNDIKRWMYSVVYLDKNTYSHSKETYSTYEEAELACLKKLIEIVK